MLPKLTTPTTVAARLRILASQESCDGEPWDTMMEAAALLDRDDKIDALAARMSEMEQWQASFDSEWTDHVAEAENIDGRVLALELRVNEF